MNNTHYISAKIEGKNIALLDRNGYRAGYASTAGLASDEVYSVAYINGNYLVGTTTRGTVITWDLSSGSPSVISRR